MAGGDFSAMKTITRSVFCLVLVGMFSTVGAQTFAVRQDYQLFPAHIDGRDYQLEAMLYRPDDSMRHPLVVFSHGRNGMFPARDPNQVYGYAAICRALSAEGNAVVFFVRRGYGNSEGPDSELQDTAVLSGLEAAKDYKAAVEYWRSAGFVLPDRVVLMGQSQGGWAALACTNVAIDGVLGVVNISGGTNYRLMGSGAVTSAVQDHWVEGCRALGAGALQPALWIYSENDQSISGPTARRMLYAYTAAGGWASLVMLPPFGANGHTIVDRPDLFWPQLNDYLATIGFMDKPDTAPLIATVDGPSAVSPGDTAVLTASVTGVPVPDLQWRRDGVNLRDGGNIAGATTSALTVSNVQMAETGNYTLVATNPMGQVTSYGVALALLITTTPPPSSPAPGSASSGGGGGALAVWFAAALSVLGGARRAVQKARKDFPGG